MAGEPSLGWTRVEKVLGLATALASLAVAVLAVFNVQSSREASAAQDTTDGLQGELDAARRQAASDARTIESLRETNDELEGQVSGLEEQLGALGGGGSTGRRSVRSSPGEPPIRHEDQVTVVDTVHGGLGIDLGAPASDPRWGESVGAQYNTDGLSLGRGMIDVRDARTREVTGPATYATCTQGLGYSAARQIDPRTMQDGNDCFILADGRVATITALEVREDRVSLDVRVWELP